MVVTSPDRTELRDPMLLRPFRVTERVVETHDTVTLTLQAADGGPPMSFRPGQFTMFYVFGIGEVPISISGDPAEPERLVHTVRAVGAVTNAICALAPGDEVGIRGPFGSSWPISAAHDSDLLVVAGGIGLAPVRPVIYHALRHRSSYRSVSLVYGARTPGDLLYTDEVHEWKGRFDANVQVTVDRAEPGWLGDVGVVTPQLRRLSFDPDATTAVVCGPEIMMRVVAKDLMARGIDAEHIHVSLERNVKCGIGYCGHCQIGSTFVCKDGPVVTYAAVARRLAMEEL